MRIFSLIVSMCVASAGLIACADEAEESVTSATPVADVAEPGPDAGAMDVSATPADVSATPGDAQASPMDAAVNDGTSLSLTIGPDDEFSQAGCALMQGEKTSPVAGSTAREAGQQVLLPNYDSGFVVALPESGVGFVTLEVPDWQVVLALYTTADVELVLHDPDDKAEVVQALSWAAPCADQEITEQRTKFHKWGGFTLELRGEPGGEVWLAAIDLPLE